MRRRLHMARTPAIVDLLVDRGADLDMRDLDHGATPAQWAIDERAICQQLIERGATPDIFIACALGDIALADQVLAAHPDALRSRSNHGSHMASRPPGGHMYIYRMGVGMRPLAVRQHEGPRRVCRSAADTRASPVEQLISRDLDRRSRSRAHDARGERIADWSLRLAPDESTRDLRRRLEQQPRGSRADAGSGIPSGRSRR